MSASGSNLQLTFIEEAAWGTTPTTPEMKVLAGITSESLGGNQDAITSNAINPNRGTDYMAPGQKNAGGDISFELGVKGAVALLARLLGTVNTTGTGPYTHVMTVGQKPKSLTIEKWLSDIGIGFVFRGCMPNSFNLTVSPDGAATGSINLLAKNYESTSAVLDATPTAASHAFADGIRAVVQIGGVTYGDLSTLSMTGTNNLEVGRGIGSDEATRIAAGKFDITGSFALPVTTERAVPLITKAVTGAEDSLKITFNIGAESVEFFFPRIKYSGDPVPKVGGPGAVNLELNFTALLDNVPASGTYQKAIKLTIVSSEASI